MAETVTPTRHVWAVPAEVCEAHIAPEPPRGERTVTALCGARFHVAAMLRRADLIAQCERCRREARERVRP